MKLKDKSLSCQADVHQYQGCRISDWCSDHVRLTLSNSKYNISESKQWGKKKSIPYATGANFLPLGHRHALPCAKVNTVISLEQIKTATCLLERSAHLARRLGWREDETMTHTNNVGANEEEARTMWIISEAWEVLIGSGGGNQTRPIRTRPGAQRHRGGQGTNREALVESNEWMCPFIWATVQSASQRARMQTQRKTGRGREFLGGHRGHDWKGLEEQRLWKRQEVGLNEIMIYLLWTKGAAGKQQRSDLFEEEASVVLVHLCFRLLVRKTFTTQSTTQIVLQTLAE